MPIFKAQELQTMAILGTLLKKGIRIREMLEEEYTSPFDLQKKELKELLISANATEFGKYYDFSGILNGFRKNHRALRCRTPRLRGEPGAGARIEIRCAAKGYPMAHDRTPSDEQDKVHRPLCTSHSFR